ncbi:MAG: NAD(+)--dinitrogen-reductase ADP-D-ribosyltransferase [Terrimicrobiaceae bacterium]
MQSAFNLCNISPWVISAREFNDNPQPIAIGISRQDNRHLFEKLEGEPDQMLRGAIFNDYMSVKFQLHDWPSHGSAARSSLKNSYVRFLRGWAMDSNSIEGAVLKSWVESRLGLPPTFHRGRVLDGSEASTMPYEVDRMRGSARTNAILSQLDVLYEFCQYELARRRPGERWITLWRGTCDAADYRVVGRGGNRRACLLMNNLSSFTSDRECAWEFGSTVWEVRVPLVKIFFFSGLLPDSLLKGEDEYLVIGGEYEVRSLLY